MTEDTEAADTAALRQPWGSGEKDGEAPDPAKPPRGGAGPHPDDVEATSTSSGGRGLGADASTGSSNPDRD